MSKGPKTRPYAEVIGDPIAQSRSPTIHNFWLGKLGLDADYRACHVRSDELGEYFRARKADDDWRGCNVTMPHKQAVQAHLDSLEAETQRIGAVNTITKSERHLLGANTDGVGFMEPLLPLLGDKTHRFGFVVGTGGAAKAIMDALHAAEFTLTSFSRDPAKAEREIGRYVWDKDLLLGIERLASSSAATRSPASADRIDVLVNASPLGMAGHPPLRVDFGGFAEDLIVYDIVTHPLDTPLVQGALAEGLRTIDGLSMLIGQAAIAFEKFFGHAAPRDDGDRELRTLLTS